MSIITMTGPTAAGKTTIERELQRLGCGRAISHTTRQPRTGEKNGNDYHFVSDSAFDRLHGEGEFVETVVLGTRRYAMSKKALRQAQTEALNAAIVVDPHGAVQIREYCQTIGIPVFSVWVDCGEQEQARRFLQRLILDHQQGKFNVIGQYAERLHMMLDDEVEWRDAALDLKIHAAYRHRYDMRLDSGSSKSPKELAVSILSYIPGGNPYKVREQAAAQ